MSSKNLLLITTGGTIDKVYSAGKGVTDMHVGEAAAPSILRRLGPSSLRFTHDALYQLDSLDIKPLYRTTIVTTCAFVENQKILITHGTDTMVETAKALEEHLNKGYLVGKTIVLTGALQPAGMTNSDAPFNLGAAFMACSTLRPGVYIVMHGKVFAPGECEKCEDGYFRRRKTKAAA